MTARIGWGLVGASNIARQRVANAIKSSEQGELVGIMSHSRALADAFAAEFAIPCSCGSLSELLAQPRIDAVYISSTNQYHHAQALAAAAAGKHVLCEKPLATDIEEAVAMVRACRGAGVVMGTNHHLRNSATIRAMRDAVAGGKIGVPMSAIVSQPVYVGDHEWRRDNPAAGSGVSFDVLVHGADAIRFVLGQEPVEACAMGRSSASMTNGVNDSIMATYRFDAGALASLYADFNAPQGRTRMEIHGRSGSLFGFDVLGKTPDHRGRVLLRHDGREEELAVESDESRYLRGINRFNAAILGTGEPSCTGIDGIRSLAMILAAEAAARTAVNVPVSRAGLDLL
jgi:1,5-anhydro-D-fructose reductase (1,5-anhydro-D-mannitol-forming)